MAQRVTAPPALDAREMAEALLDKLVEKGQLTQAEAEQVRDAARARGQGGASA